MTRDQPLLQPIDAGLHKERELATERKRATRGRVLGPQSPPRLALHDRGRGGMVVGPGLAAKLRAGHLPTARCDIHCL